MRIISVLSLTVAALTFSLACERPTSTPLTLAGPTVMAGAVSISIIGERQMLIGDTLKLRAIAAMSDGSTRDVSSDATWTSSNTVVCATDTAGLIVAASAGVCDISATFNSITTTASFLVVVSGWTGDIISIVVLGPRTLTIGDGDRYVVVANMPDGSQAELTTGAEFSSSNPSVAEIDRDGRVVALAEGSTTITVAASGMEVAFRVVVLAPQAPEAP